MLPRLVKNVLVMAKTAQKCSAAFFQGIFMRKMLLVMTNQLRKKLTELMCLARSPRD